MTFHGIIKIVNGNPYILVSRARAQKLKAGWKKPMPVIIQINGKPEKPWRINMMPIGDGSFYLYLHGDVRTASHTGVGDRVQVNVVFDTTYKNGPMHPMPAVFRAMLKQNPRAQKAWNALIPSRKKEILRYFSFLKSPEAKQRNMEKALKMLDGAKGRLMGRDWNKN